jgi:hypothetical protein
MNRAVVTVANSNAGRSCRDYRRESEPSCLGTKLINYFVGFSQVRERMRTFYQFPQSSNVTAFSGNFINGFKTPRHPLGWAINATQRKQDGKQASLLLPDCQGTVNDFVAVVPSEADFGTVAHRRNSVC